MAGARQKVTISDNVTLDFSGLFSSEDPIGKEQAEKKPEQAKTLLHSNQKKKEESQKSIEVYKEYQENIRQSEQLQIEILNGIKTGEDVYTLFLKAVKAISLMTSNTGFFSKIEQDTRAIYGKGLNYKPPLQNELQDTQKRLSRLEEAELRETQPDSQERIKRAIQAHREYIEELKAMIAKA